MEPEAHAPYYTPQMLEDIPIGIALLDAKDFHPITANRCFRELFANSAMDQEHSEATSSDTVFSVPTFAFIQNLFQYVLETGKAYHGHEFPVLHPQRGITYWNGGITPIYDQANQISQLLITASDVTPQVLARRQVEEEQKSLQTSHTEVDTELQRLAVIETIARSVRKELESKKIALVATEALVEAFDPSCVCIHIARPASQELLLIHMYIDKNDQSTEAMRLVAPNIQNIPYSSRSWLVRARNYREPLIIDDLMQTPRVEPPTDKPPLKALSTNGYICIPLWFQDHFEGTLTVFLRETININGLVARALIDCSTYISAALAHSRLIGEVEYERKRLSAVLDHIPEGIFLTEAGNGKLSYANEAATRLLRVQESQLLELSLRDLHDLQSINYRARQADGQELTNARFPTLRALQGETVVGEEIQLTTPEKETLILLFSAAPILNEHGAIISAATIFQDITTRKSLEEQKNEFLSIASHELRTPITAILGFAEILQMLTSMGQDLASPHVIQAIEAILEQSTRLTRQIDEMLDLSSLQHTLLALNKAPHDLVGILKHAISSMAITDKQHTLSFVLQGLNETETLIGEFDEERIRQVINNLISNALKYSKTGSEVEIGLRSLPQQPGRALIWVRDSGVGIPARDLPLIFERFHRAGNFDRSISGLGIGLYLTRELVVQHGGSIRVESREGVGSTFSVELPLSQPASEPGQVKPQREEEKKSQCTN